MEIQNHLYLVPFRTTGSRLPLFCFPGAGNEHSTFDALAALVGEDQPVYSVDMVKFYETRQNFTIEKLAEFCHQVISETQEHGPYYLCGYSFGGFVAYEVATRLANEGKEIGLLALFDARNPAFMSNLPVTKSVQFRAIYLRDRLGKYGRNLRQGKFEEVAMSILALLGNKMGEKPRSLLRAVFRMLNRPFPEVFELNDPIVEAACRAYSPPRYANRLVLFRSQKRGPEFDIDLNLGWGLCAVGGIDVYVVPGDHLDMMARPNVYKVMEKLAVYLDKSARH